LAGFFVHDVLSRSSGVIEQVWRSKLGTQTELLDALTREIQPIKAERLMEWKDELEERFEHLDIDSLRIVAETRLAGIIEGLAQFMAPRPPPNHILTELQITNTETHHEGRIDALFEWDERYATLDFKTYADEVPRSHSYDHLQIVANGMLANYRHNHIETDFSSNELAIIYAGGVYLPRATERMIEKVVAARSYVLGCIQTSGSAPIQQLTHTVCYVCQMPESCSFYKRLEGLHRSGELSEAEEQLRSASWRRRYAILDFRQISHKNKFLVSLNDYNTLEKYGVLETGYSITSRSDGETLLLHRNGGSSIFLEGDTVKAVGLEKCTPTLASVNFNGAITAVNPHGVEVTFNDRRANDAYRLMRELPVCLMKTEIDLTKRELQALDYIQRRAPEQIRKVAQALLGEE
jgi:hypothetical protein